MRGELGNGQEDKSTAAKADRLVIVKSTRTLTLFNHGQVLKTYQVALGGDPVGAKTKAGDQKTPEGEYVIDSKNPHSRFHLALHISYPNAADRKRARKLGVSPGGDVEIHSLESKYAWVGSLPRQTNWTPGCVAVTNPEIEEIYKLVPVGTPVEIRADDKPVEHPICRWECRMKFSEIANRLTGISTPLVGVSWQPTDLEVSAARRVIAFLEDRRVLYAPEEMEMPEHCVRSVLEIRHFLSGELGKLDAKSEFAASLRAMRAACRKFLDRVGTDGREVTLYANHHGQWASWTFYSALGEMRGTFGVHLAKIAAEFKLDIGDRLAEILPARANDSDDDDHLPARRVSCWPKSRARRLRRREEG